ncbi:MAG: undecaprenyl-diphosphate phosphatase [Desulfosarcina sp.]
MTLTEIIIIAIVEGLTEFLPVSSTGHMILTQALLGVESTGFVKMFIVNIQFGAILSVVVLYRKRFFQSLDFYYKLLAAFLPAAVIGFLLIDYIDMLLESVLVVAIMLFIGGVILIGIDQWFEKKGPSSDNAVTYSKALKIGLFQCLAMIPGVSRSAATIIGGMTQRLDRKTAAEFSFFLAVPTMFAAAGYKLYQSREWLSVESLPALAVGNAIAFVVAMLAIKGFIGFLTRYGFKVFGWYRILVSLIIFILLLLKVDLTIV